MSRTTAPASSRKAFLSRLVENVGEDPMWCAKAECELDVEEEVHDVTVLDDVFLAFGGEAAGGAYGGF